MTLITRSQKRRGRGRRRPLPEHLPRERRVIDLPESEKICQVHGQALVRIREVVSETLEIIPAKVFVREDAVQKYKCPCCEASFHSAQKDPSPIPKSFASPSLLAYIVTAKYVDGRVLQKATEKMRDGPSNSPFRRRVQTTISCVAKEAA